MEKPAVTRMIGKTSGGCVCRGRASIAGVRALAILIAVGLPVRAWAQDTKKQEPDPDVTRKMKQQEDDKRRESDRIAADKAAAGRARAVPQQTQPVTPNPGGANPATPGGRG